jgi:hypothetical protein
VNDFNGELLFFGGGGEVVSMLGCLVAGKGLTAALRQLEILVNYSKRVN